MEAKWENSGDDLIISFSGEIDEHADFSQIPTGGANRFVLDLNNVNVLNSSGLRSWVMWIDNVDASAGIAFRNCPRIVVDQMNVLAGFVPDRAEVESFYVPYYCEECDYEHPYMAERGKDFSEGANASNSLSETMACPKCSEEMELDVLPAKYFKFLKR